MLVVAGYGICDGAIGIAALPGSLLFGVFWATIGPGWAFGIGAALAGLAAALLAVLPAETRNGGGRVFKKDWREPSRVAAASEVFELGDGIEK